MRTINATLLSNQKALGGDPKLTITIGTAPNTIAVSAFVLSYDYEEIVRSEGGLTIYLDNSGSEFSPTRSGSYAYVTPGAEVEVKRGLTVTGSDYTEELPTTWIEDISFERFGGQSTCVLTCIDWRGKLDRLSATTAQSWAATDTETPFEWILTEAGLTRASGSMTSVSLEFDIDLLQNLHTALRRLLRKVPEYAYPGIDKQIKWKDIDSGDSSDYTIGWNADHPALSMEAGSGAWEINKVLVNGRGGATGNASDAAQASAVGTRQWTIYDNNLSTNAECTQRATAELDLYEAEATTATITCRPIHGLELLDVLTIDSPPWSGDNFVGRCIRFREEWNHDGRWHQVIGLGAVPDKDPGNQPAKRRRRKSRRSRKRRRRRSRKILIPWPPGYEPWTIPVGGIILWSGAIVDIPINWQICDGTNGTPDLRNSFVVGAGDTYNPDDTGGAASTDLTHGHDSGTLNTANDAHTHGSDTLATNSDQHTHASGTLNTANDTHDHNVDSGATASGSSHNHAISGSAGAPDGGETRDTDDTGASAVWASHTHSAGGLVTAAESAHTHASGTLNTANDTHDHNVDSGATASDSHSHSVDSGATDSDSHDHDVDSGATADALGATAILPPYYALAYIMRLT